MSDIFVSHAHSTAAVARQIADALRSHGHSVWWDDEIPLHRSFSRVIDDHVRNAKAVVVLWSADALESDWVRGEADVARQAGTLVQITVDHTVPPLPFSQIQYADLPGWSGDTNAPGWRKVVASVDELVSGVLPQAPPIAENADAAPSRSTMSRNRILGAVLALVLAIGAVSIWYVVARAPHVTGQDATAGGTPDDRVANPDGGIMNRPAIAVLPFENLSDDPKHAIFADGLSGDLITRLSAWRAFPVLGRGASFQYRGNVDIKRVAKELNVRYVVQGSVQRESDRIRINAQLLDAQSGQTVWNQTFDRKVADMFDLQDEISMAIAAPLVGDLSRAEAHRAQSRGTRNVDAWSLYESGEALIEHPTPKNMTEARAFYERAVALEPQFASARAELSVAIAWGVVFDSVSAPEHNLALALESARRAVDLDPNDAQAHSALAFALQMSGDTTANALASAQRGVDLNPSSPHALTVLGYEKLMAGDPQGCIVAIERALRLDPQAFVVSNHENLSESYFELGRFELGLEHARKALAAQPEYVWGYLDAAMSAVGLGRLDEARAAVAEARRIQPQLSLAWVRQSSSVTDADMLARWTAALHEAGLD